MEIRLKKFVNEQNWSLTGLSEETGIAYILLVEIYTSGEFEEKLLSFSDLTNLMIAFQIMNIHELVPTYR